MRGADQRAPESARARLATFCTHNLDAGNELVHSSTLLGDDLRAALAAAADRSNATWYPRTLEVIVDRRAARYAALVRDVPALARQRRRARHDLA